nr:unnamed protein product [Digitaria exilis]
MADGGDNMDVADNVAATDGGIAPPPPSAEQRLHQLNQRLHHLQHLAPGFDERVRRRMIGELQEELDLELDFDVVIDSGGGGGASAVAVGGLEKQTFHAAGCGGGTECAICLVDFEDGEEVSVMPCFHGHGFHQDCIAKWLWRSNKCPLCRHQIPTGIMDG